MPEFESPDTMTVVDNESPVPPSGSFYERLVKDVRQRIDTDPDRERAASIKTALARLPVAAGDERKGAYATVMRYLIQRP